MGRSQQRRPKRPDIKPAADPSLKKVFSRIGVPERHPFAPDPFQTEALDAVSQGDCLVTAPTGAGKTWIAEQVIARMLQAGKRTWYASPLKALSNSKFTEFSERFGSGHIGILTGDRKENPDAPIIVGTTEILRNQLYDAMHRGEILATDFVILDEAHFLGDAERGVVWEEIMIYLPSRIPLLMLSATIGNADAMAQWLRSVRTRPCIVVRETRRPVPLFAMFLHPTGRLLPLTAGSSKKKPGRLHKKVSAFASQRRPVLMAPRGKLPPFGEILHVLRTFNLLPAIFFLKSRADCNRALDLCRGNRPADADRNALRRQKMQELAGQSPHIARHRQRQQLEDFAVGAHHAGQLPAWKLVLETLMNRGLMDAVFATSTVAAGVNFPARTVAFLNTDRFNGKAFLPLDPTEFHQMTGRAGRRGMDRIGFALAVPGKFMDLRLAARLMDAPPSDVYSRIHVNFSMVLNLLLSHAPEQIEDLLSRSFAAYLIRQAQKMQPTRRPASDGVSVLIEAFRAHLAFLAEQGFVTADGTLTEDGIWASRLRVDQPLLIAEGFRRCAFPETDPALLAATVASLISDRDRDLKSGSQLPACPAKLAEAFARLVKGLRPFQQHMAARGFETRPLTLQPARVIYRWATGGAWDRLTSAGGIEAGDLVMLVLRTADHLRHIRALQLFFPEAAHTAKAAIARILKDPVTMDPSGRI